MNLHSKINQYPVTQAFKLATKRYLSKTKHKEIIFSHYWKYGNKNNSTGKWLWNTINWKLACEYTTALGLMVVVHGGFLSMNSIQAEEKDFQKATQEIIFQENR